MFAIYLGLRACGDVISDRVLHNIMDEIQECLTSALTAGAPPSNYAEGFVLSRQVKTTTTRRVSIAWFCVKTRVTQPVL